MGAFELERDGLLAKIEHQSDPWKKRKDGIRKESIRQGWGTDMPE